MQAAFANRAHPSWPHSVKRVLGGVGLDLVTTRLAPQSDAAWPRRRCRASSMALGSISSAASLSLMRGSLPVAFLGCRRSCRRRRGWRARQLRADTAQQADARRHREPVVFNDGVEFSEKRLGFFGRQPELYVFGFCQSVMLLIGNRRVSPLRQSNRQQAGESCHNSGFENHAGEFCHPRPGSTQEEDQTQSRRREDRAACHPDEADTP